MNTLLSKFESIERHFEVSQYTDEKKCMFYLGALCRCFDETTLPILRELKEHPYLKVSDIYLRRLAEKVCKNDDPIIIELHNRFHDTYSPKVDDMAYVDKQYYFTSGYALSKDIFNFGWMTASEADERWGKANGTVRVAISRGRFGGWIAKGEVRKSGNTWLLTEKAMIDVYGPEHKQD